MRDNAVPEAESSNHKASPLPPHDAVSGLFSPGFSFQVSSVV